MSKITFTNCNVQIGMQNCSVNKGAKVDIHFPENKNEKPKVEVSQVIDKAVIMQSQATELPLPNHYADTARWIIRQKPERDYIREANNNIEQLARILSPILGWQVEGLQLRKALNRIQ